MSVEAAVVRCSFKAAVAWDGYKRILIFTLGSHSELSHGALSSPLISCSLSLSIFQQVSPRKVKFACGIRIQSARGKLAPIVSLFSHNTMEKIHSLQSSLSVFFLFYFLFTNFPLLQHRNHPQLNLKRGSSSVFFKRKKQRNVYFTVEIQLLLAVAITTRSFQSEACVP